MTAPTPASQRLVEAIHYRLMETDDEYRLCLRTETDATAVKGSLWYGDGYLVLQIYDHAKEMGYLELSAMRVSQVYSLLAAVLHRLYPHNPRWEPANVRTRNVKANMESELGDWWIAQDGRADKEHGAEEALRRWPFLSRDAGMELAATVCQPRDEEAVQLVSAALASMGQEERSEIAKHTHITLENLNAGIERWKKSRQ
jgi:hypothetical protein